jgi:hypothetical protein
VHGVIYISKRPLEGENRGVCLKVNNRGVSGMKERWNIANMSQSLESSLYAEVNADGLRDEVRGDWRGIEEGSPKFEEVFNYVRSQIRKIKTHRDNVSSHEQGDRAMQRFEEVKAIATEKVRKSSSRSSSGSSHGSSSSPVYVNEVYIPETDEPPVNDPKHKEAISSGIGYVEKTKDGSARVVISPRFLRTSKGIDDSSLEDQIGIAASFLLAYHSTQEGINQEFKTKKTREPAMKVLDEFKQNFLAQWNDMYGDSDTLETAISKHAKSSPRAPVSETKLYAASEIEKLRGIRRLTINRLVECGALEYARVGDEVRNNMFLVRQVYAALEPVSIHDTRTGIRFHTAVWEILRKMYSKDANFNAAENVLNSQLDDLAERGQLPDYLMRIGKEGNPPMYWVKEGFEDAFVELYHNSQLLDRRIRSDHPDDSKGGKNNPFVYDPSKQYHTNDYIIMTGMNPETGERIGTVRVSYTYQKEGRFFAQSIDGEKVPGSFEMAKYAGSKPDRKEKGKK